MYCDTAQMCSNSNQATSAELLEQYFSESLKFFFNTCLWNEDLQKSSAKLVFNHGKILKQDLFIYSSALSTKLHYEHMYVTQGTKLMGM